MAKEELPTKFFIDFKDENGKLESRWYYDRTYSAVNPIMTENFNLPRKEKRTKKSSKLKEKQQTGYE